MTENEIERQIEKIGNTILHWSEENLTNSETFADIEEKVNKINQILDEGCQCRDCLRAKANHGEKHSSDCGVHSEPAEDRQECNCSLGDEE